MSNYMDSFNFDLPKKTVAQKNERAWDLARLAMDAYKIRKAKLKPEQSINLICSVASSNYEVHEILAHDGFLEISSVDESGDICLIYAPVEQISFTVMILNKKAEEPAREISFHVGMKFESKTEG